MTEIIMSSLNGIFGYFFLELPIHLSRLCQLDINVILIVAMIQSHQNRINTNAMI